MVRLLHAARTDVGMIRSGNEDNFSVKAGGNRGLFIVADGMGGHAAGEVASEMAVQTIERELDTLKELDESLATARLTDALRKANPDADPGDLDLNDRVHEIADSHTPIYNGEIRAWRYFHSDDMNDAYRDAGIGDASEDNHDQVCIFCLIEADLWGYFRELCVEAEEEQQA